ncbi:MAG: sodium:proton antiporter [Desulfobacteraceae bacterium]|nr:MAG: sodium:proton antiporter [Desulfobacteraceae bacterium]
MVEELFKAFDSYDMWLAVIGAAILAAAILPKLLEKYPLSLPIVLLLIGYMTAVLPLGLEAPDPKRHGRIIEHVTEFGVIITLMGAGLKIDRPFSMKGWNSTWRLLGITMVLTIALTAFIGWWVAAFLPSVAVLFGAVIAPTDPVLASEVQVGAPGEGMPKQRSDKGEQEEEEIRFALTSEAGLNDGLAFPFTNMAIAMAIAGSNPVNWIGAWLLVDVLYKLFIGAVFGIAIGSVLARIVIALPAESPLEKSMIGLGSLFSTLMIYGATEYAGGYGFIAVFVGGIVIRGYERHHDYHKEMHVFSEATERVMTAIIVVAFGVSLADGLLAPLTWPLVLCALLIVFVVRPACGLAALAGCRMSWPERFTVSFFGIRGIGSLYYLSYALNQRQFADDEKLWPLVALVVVISIFVHGIIAAPALNYVGRWGNRTGGD